MYLGIINTILQKCMLINDSKLQFHKSVISNWLAYTIINNNGLSWGVPQTVKVRINCLRLGPRNVHYLSKLLFSRKDSCQAKFSFGSHRKISSFHWPANFLYQTFKMLVVLNVFQAAIMSRKTCILMVSSSIFFSIENHTNFFYYK